jgi:hypothetical protein
MFKRPTLVEKIQLAIAVPAWQVDGVTKSKLRRNNAE